jgi:hypothetical protein
MVKKRTVLWGSSILLPFCYVIGWWAFVRYQLQEDQIDWVSSDILSPVLVCVPLAVMLPWVVNLLWLGIQRLLRAMAQRDIRNLQALRSSGVLTQEEYEQRLAPLKAKL